MASKLEKLNLSTDELDRFQKAMSDPTFRDLLRDYTQEISDPSNRAETEAYLREIEARAAEDEQAQKYGKYDNVPGAANIPHGMKLVSPQPVFCMKVCLEKGMKRKATGKDKAATTLEEELKIFINLCICDAMDDVSSEKIDASKQKGKQPTPSQPGQHFSLPYSLSASRTCTDAHGKQAKVYDFVFSSATWVQYHMNLRIVTMFQDMALDSVLEAEGFAAASESLKNKRSEAVTILKNTTFKGGKPPPRLFKISKEKLEEMKKVEEAEKAKQTKEEETKVNDSAPAPSASSSGPKVISTKSKSSPTPIVDIPLKVDARATPKHTLTHRGYYSFTAGQMELSNEPKSFVEELMKGRPDELVLKLDLPEVKKIADVNLDQSATEILLTSNSYYFHYTLPYPVISEPQGHAQWNNKMKCLTITMKVGSPSAGEIEKYREQRKGYDEAVKRKQAEEEQEKKREEEEEKEKEKEAALKLKEQKEKEATDAAAATPAVTITASEDRIPHFTPPSSNTPPLPSALKSSFSPVMSPTSLEEKEKRVRFQFTQSETSGGIPERDGPLGPKPVNKLVQQEETVVVVKKGHKKKHIPGTEGPAEWTGIGVEPSKELAALFPAVELPPQSGLESPLNATKKKAQQAAVAWPAYTYSQSNVSVVIVIKIKSILPETVKLSFPISTSTSASADRTTADLLFATPSTNNTKKWYRLYLPLAYACNTVKSSYDCTKANLIVNLIKLPVGGETTIPEWHHLLDYSEMGYETDGTPLSSPMIHSTSSSSTSGGAMEALHLNDDALLTPGNALIHDVTSDSTVVTEAEVELEAPSVVESTPIPQLTMQPITVHASSMLNSAASSVPSNSILFQLD